MPRVLRRSAAALAVVSSILASSWVTPGPVSAWANAGDGYATHDWVVDKALDILDHAGKRPDWFDRDLALPYTDDPDTVERAEDPSRGWEHVYYDNERHGGAVQRVAEHYTAALEALAAGDTSAATINVALLSHFLADIGQPYHTARAGLGQSSMHQAYESAVKARTRTPGGPRMVGSHGHRIEHLECQEDGRADGRLLASPLRRSPRSVQRHRIGRQPDGEPDHG